MLFVHLCVRDSMFVCVSVCALDERALGLGELGWCALCERARASAVHSTM